ncbi:MAG: FKBP-type peptidyl-prolyl cis-trans isomerase [Chromatiales bacterium]|nr:FKBP-type peptidyl-prolyl cis-trans isomerase [Chromatiales bacterium]
MTDRLTVQPGKHVTMHIRIVMDNGIVAEDTFGDEPLMFVVGDGTVLAKLEETLIGLPLNEPTRTLITAAEGFGAHDPANVHAMPRADFPPGVDVAPGLVIGFSTPSGEEVAGTILSDDGETVEVDFNHPLAGHNLTVDVEILAIGEIPTQA